MINPVNIKNWTWVFAAFKGSKYNSSHKTLNFLQINQKFFIPISYGNGSERIIGKLIEI